MNDFHNALAMIKGKGIITAEQTFFVDNALSSVRAFDVPVADTIILLDYIDAHLTHNLVDKEIRLKLELLYDELRSRQDPA